MGKIRMATAADTKAILDIYAPYIEHTNITFEYVVPTEAEFASRIEEILEKYPYLVYEEDGVIGGYAYAHQFMGRAASQWGVFPRCGFKHGKWLGLMWLEKPMVERREPLPFQKVWDVDEKKIAEILENRSKEVRS